MRKALKPSLFLVVAITLLTLMACGIDGDYKSNQSPEISITSWEGYDSLDVHTIHDSLVFQQKIYWNSFDTDGTVEGIAYRILDENNEPLSSPGNEVIDENGDVETLTISGAEETGWVLHYKDGANENIPLSSANASKTIWTNEQYALVNFPAADEDGNPVIRDYTFEVVCIDNRGAVSNIASKEFKAKSDRPNCLLSTSKGNPNGRQVGTGIEITFAMTNPDDSDFVAPGASNYEFKILKKEFVDGDDEEDNEDYSNDNVVFESEWISTNNFSDMESFRLTQNTDKNFNNILATADEIYPMDTDFDGEDEDANQFRYTEIMAKAYNLAGVASDVDTIRFAVKKGFYPKTLIYQQKTYALGDYHFVDYPRASDKEVYPYIDMEEPNPDKSAVRMFTNMDGKKSVINSANLKTYVKWGYHGEYGIPPTGTAVAYVISDNPYDKKINQLLDERTNQNYYSEIIAYHIRLDDAAYDFFALQDNIVTHEDDGVITEWLEVPVNSVWNISQSLELLNLEPGDHKLEISAFDLQDQYDPTPAVVEFTIENYTPKEERSGILMVDADELREAGAPSFDYSESRSQEIYAAAMEQFGDNVTYVNRAEVIANNEMNDTDCAFAPSDLLKYKTIIYRNEAFTSSTFNYDNDALNIFLSEGGNLILIGTKNIKAINDDMYNTSKKLMRDYFGIVYDTESVDIVSNSSAQNPFFLGATSAEGYPELNLDLSANAISFLIDLKQGLGGIGFFTDIAIDPEDYITKPIYNFTCKAVDDADIAAPSQEQFDTFSQKPVALSRVTEDNKCYIFTFPLSYMEQDDLTSLLGQIVEP